MKKTILITLAVMAFGISNANASFSRLAVMGDGASSSFSPVTGGSLYVDDIYNIFHNPAYINDHTNWGIMEKSNGIGQGMGGFAMGMGAFNIGVYFNREMGTGLSNHQLPIDITIGADMGIKWGVALSMARTDADNTDMTLRAGVSVANLEPWAEFTMTDKDKVGVNEFKSKHMAFGAKYKMGEWAPYAAYRQDKPADLDANKSSTVGGGIARSSKISNGVMLNYALSVWSQNTPGTASTIVVPLAVSVEGEAASWITLRAGLNVARKAGTTARLGSTFNFGKFGVDWAVGNNIGGNANTVNMDSANFSVAEGFFTLASLHYKW